MRTARPQKLPLLRVCGTVQQNPHMRAFWASTISFFLAFLGWFALAPLGLEVATSMGQCENQLYPPASNPYATSVPEVQEPQEWPSPTASTAQWKNSDGKLNRLSTCACRQADWDRRGADAVPTWGVGQMCLHNRNWLQRHYCKCRGSSSGIHHLCSHCTWHIAGAIWSCERAIRPADLWSFLGGHGGGHFSSMELHLDPILHWLCRSYLCDQPILVFAHVFAQCGRHCQCHCSRLGATWVVVWHRSSWSPCCSIPWWNSGMAADTAWRVSMNRSCGPFPDLRCHHEALVLGHSQG